MHGLGCCGIGGFVPAGVEWSDWGQPAEESEWGGIEQAVGYCRRSGYICEIFSIVSF